MCMCVRGRVRVCVHVWERVRVCVNACMRERGEGVHVREREVGGRWEAGMLEGGE